MSERLPRLDPAELTPDQRRYYDAIIDGPRGNIALPDGSLPGPFGPLLRVPVIGHAVQAVGAELRFHGRLPAELREVAILTVARETQSDFEWTAHERIARHIGIDADFLAELRQGRPSRWAGPRVEAVHDATVEILTSHDLGDATFEQLHHVLDGDEIVELICVVGYYSLLAMLLNSLRVDVAPGAP
jgi:4-carboxymuconolactone decarboxylase